MYEQSSLTIKEGRTRIQHDKSLKQYDKANSNMTTCVCVHARGRDIINSKP